MPILESQDLDDRAQAQAVLRGDFGFSGSTPSAFPQGSDGVDVLFGEFRAWMVRAVTMAALVVAVGVVLLRRAEKQVFRINAASIVAPMADVQTVWNRAVRPFVHQAMRPTLSALFVTDDAVAFAMNRALPRPADIRRSRRVVALEALLQRHESKAIRAGARAHDLRQATTRFLADLAERARTHRALLVGFVWPNHRLILQQMKSAMAL